MGGGWGLSLFLAWLVGFPLVRWYLKRTGRGPGPGGTSSGGPSPWWVPSAGSWSTGRSSGGFSGGFSGGGGSFGGGGASGGW